MQDENPFAVSHASARAVAVANETPSVAPKAMSVAIAARVECVRSIVVGQARSVFGVSGGGDGSGFELCGAEDSDI
jgi:hypothetical protein